MINNKKNGLGK